MFSSSAFVGNVRSVRMQASSRSIKYITRIFLSSFQIPEMLPSFESLDIHANWAFETSDGLHLSQESTFITLRMKTIHYSKWPDVFMRDFKGHEGNLAQWTTAMVWAVPRHRKSQRQPHIIFMIILWLSRYNFISKII